MAKIIIETKLQAGNGCRAEFREDMALISSSPTLWRTGAWPLDEFDELVEFVREHQKNLKQAEVQTVG